jgi:hypothetical protein
MANAGIYPLDPTSDVGKLRLTLGDVNSVPLDPPVSGMQDYTKFSDDELTAFIDEGNDSILRAAGYAYLALAAQAAIVGRSTKDHDLAIDTRNRSESLTAIATMYFGQAAEIDGGDGFEVFTIGGDSEWIAELTPPIWGRRYSWDRWL